MRRRFIAAGGTLALVMALGWPTAAVAAPPTATVTISETMLAIGDTAVVTITFSEAVTGIGPSTVTATGGVLSALTTSDNMTYTAVFTPSTATQSAGNVVTLNFAGIQNGAGEATSGAIVSDPYTVDTVRPTLASSIQISDTELLLGESATVTFVFTESVTGFDVGDVTVPNASLLGLNSPDGRVWTATLTPDADVTDASNILTLYYSSITDAAGNAGMGSFSSGNYGVFTARPRLAGPITISDTALRAGETATVTFTFAEPVTGFDTADVIAPNGVLSMPTSPDGGTTWTATFTPNPGTQVAANTFTLIYAGVMTVTGNPGAGTATSGNYAVDTLPPTGTISLSDSALVSGETARVVFTFSEAVTGFDTSDIAAGSATLSSLASADGGVTWTATLTPEVNTTSPSNVIALDLAGVTDLAGNAGTGTATSTAYAVDTVATPAATPPAPPAEPAVAPLAGVAGSPLPLTGGNPTGMLLAGALLTAAGLALTVTRRRVEA
ncbi:Ig-like domain-containing protein [Salinibacterium hongtaonis]|uniref:Ig-like domain-containing protein n=1 Tax=Homoserinimonas hongtaonis TaxID=2079791 RepID=UPI000D3C6004|nr:hypothetical protein C2138_03385 [Salinibacterium hongtaonis]